ncbi:AlpA family phage regulatory protein [Pasteurella skyensis]|uniref:AlpA family phage regulatory protein n=1 Tax=Phocoenobacter skyensis TaxID=97481 RepID=A0AAJ6P0J9_9PAST|nr:AlpA family phage regulatory protein [Pasteurella skyensis]MDP8162186.1 AlpA family phage regulatory protein [Pasteurella skyensis]MDP8172650.1 AlpA family phage regulatory protein [Pasteurella skyensis]MDP8176812.1 AlpA family phage regulatory protein [Pasteurella skyensis]MDP8179150.1 AlpA family phage regulatory protein [Pasteurella skyensis]MDP8183395.1 AlpA family phage regulatory protein [Pasteurella skyensis]
MEQTNQPTTKKLLLDINDVKAITGFCTTTIYQHVKKGTFPAPKNCGGRSVRWRLADIENYVNS